MPKPARKRPPPIILLLAFGIATFAALLLAEVALRLFVSQPLALGQLSFQTGTGAPITLAEGAAQGLIIPVPAKTPRRRFMLAPDQTFYLCYSDNDVLQRDWFDDKDRVAAHINRFGLHERAEILPDKPAGQRRIVCLGDSFTFGWGIPSEQGWVRLLEGELRRDEQNIRTVNCGAAGTLCVDEYWYGLKHRFHVFEPDAVILTICLNDLIPSSGLNVLDLPQATGIRLVDLALSALNGNPLDLDPSRDWVQELLELPQKQGRDGGMYHADKPFEAMWSQGVPQTSLRETKAWCDERKIPFMVILWPFMQGLGNGRHYPFQKLHDLVAADCEQAGIPFLDVLPALADTDHEELWVTPADPHPNPLAQQLVLPSVTRFVRRVTGW